MRSVRNPVDRTAAQDALLRAWAAFAFGVYRKGVDVAERVRGLDCSGGLDGALWGRMLDELDYVVKEATAAGVRAGLMIDRRELTESEKEHGRTIVAALRWKERADEERA